MKITIKKHTHFFRGLVAMMAAIMLITSIGLFNALTVEARAIYADRFVNTQSGPLNLRASPNTSARIITQIPRGVRVWVRHTTNVGGRTWARAYFGTTNTYSGYVDASFLRHDPLPGVSERLTGHRYVNVNSSLNVRRTPGGSVIASAQRNTRVRVYYAVSVGTTRWARITLPNGTQGYVSAAYLSNTPVGGGSTGQPSGTTLRTYNRNNTNQRLIRSNGQETPYFRVAEVMCQCGGRYCGPTFRFDSRLVDILHNLRQHFGRPIIVISGHRCTQHNRNVGGVANSNHIHGRAVDVRINGVSNAEIVRVARMFGAGADTYVGASAHIAVG